MSLPQGEDPDSFVHNYGKDKFEEYVKSAKIFLEYQTSYYESQGLLKIRCGLPKLLKNL